MTLDSIHAFYATDPIVAWLLTAAAVFVLAGMIARLPYALRERWAIRRERREADQRRRLGAAVQVTEPRPWPAPQGPKGITNKFPRAS